MKNKYSTLSKIGWGVIIYFNVAAISSSLCYLLPPALHIALTGVLYGDDFVKSQMPHYFANPIVTFFHLFPGALLLLIGTLQFSEKIRIKRVKLHRTLGTIFLIGGPLIVLSGFYMVFKYGYRGIDEIAPTLFFGSVLLFSSWKGYYWIRHKQFELHREWMIRAYSIVLGISMIRIYGVILLFSTSLSTRDFFSTIFWMGWSTTLVAGEIWINLSRESVVKNTQISPNTF